MTIDNALYLLGLARWGARPGLDFCLKRLSVIIKMTSLKRGGVMGQHSQLKYSTHSLRRFRLLLDYNQSLKTASEGGPFDSVVRALVLYWGGPVSIPSEAALRIF